MVLLESTINHGRLRKISSCDRTLWQARQESCYDDGRYTKYICQWVPTSNYYQPLLDFFSLSWRWHSRHIECRPSSNPAYQCLPYAIVFGLGTDPKISLSVFAPDLGEAREYIFFLVFTTLKSRKILRKCVSKILTAAKMKQKFFKKVILNDCRGCWHELLGNLAIVNDTWVY